MLNWPALRAPVSVRNFATSVSLGDPHVAPDPTPMFHTECDAKGISSALRPPPPPEAGSGLVEVPPGGCHPAPGADSDHHRLTNGTNCQIKPLTMASSVTFEVVPSTAPLT